MKEIKIDSISLKIGTREINLSIEECKKLHDALSELFKTRIEYRDRWYWNHITYPYAPPITYSTIDEGSIKISSSSTTASNFVSFEINGSIK